MPKTSLYGGHLEKRQTYNFDCTSTGLRNPDKMGVDTKIVFLNGLEANILPKTQCNDCRGAIVFLPLEKFLKDANLAST